MCYLQAALSSGLDLFVNKFEKETGVLLGSLPRASLFTNVSFTDSDISASVVSCFRFLSICRVGVSSCTITLSSGRRLWNPKSHLPRNRHYCGGGEDLAWTSVFPTKVCMVGVFNPIFAYVNAVSVVRLCV
jgi:hypothetical protein